ncbi:DUF6338 family protein [Longispora albida]|uniref:DUF6338 family protein n=1 Tax=Longispora albida TaxID=203523 RepID=UPI0003607FA7|nr:DUF6338 family protein [Longispora albida]
MPGTFTALVVAVLAVLPGAAYLFVYEKQAGSFRVAWADRLLRFGVASAVFHACAAGLTYHLYREYVLTGRLVKGTVPLLLVQVAVVAYVAVPAAAGLAAGLAVRRRMRGFGWLNSRAAEPRAWDHVFSASATMSTTFVMRTKSGIYLAGVFGVEPVSGRRSFASGYPEPGDIYFSQTLDIDSATGEVTRVDGRPVLRPAGLLIRWDEIEFAQLHEGGRRHAQREEPRAEDGPDHAEGR